MAVVGMGGAVGIAHVYVRSVGVAVLDAVEATQAMPVVSRTMRHHALAPDNPTLSDISTSDRHPVGLGRDSRHPHRLTHQLLSRFHQAKREIIGHNHPLSSKPHYTHTRESLVY